MSHTEFRGKRRKLDTDDNEVNTSKPSARFTPIEGGRQWTVSVAVPGSILSDTFTADQRMTSPGRIARALAVFSVDEVIIYDDSPLESRPKRVDHERYTGDLDPCHFIEHVLSYLEAPPFMRKMLFPLHPNLRLAGQLPSLDMPHHPNPLDWLPYREGVTTDARTDTGEGTVVDVGLKQPVTIKEEIPPKTRLTLQFASPTARTAEPVHPTAPREEGGYFWGYSVRRCPSLSSVFTECPYEDGYDVSIGTSERGWPISRAFPSTNALDFKHLLIVFGGPRGIEFAAMNDEELKDIAVSGGRTRELFDHWINVLPGQGSRTIRTDEAVFIALTGLRRLWDESG